MCRNILDIKVGVEYCTPQTILHALKNPRMSVRGRKDITWDDLEDLNLVQPCGVRVSHFQNVYKFHMVLLINSSVNYA